MTILIPLLHAALSQNSLKPGYKVNKFKQNDEFRHKNIILCSNWQLLNFYGI